MAASTNTTLLPSIPKSIVIYNYYGEAVYVDGVLLDYFSQGHYQTSGWSYLCQLFDIGFERRDVHWEDWPGMDKNRNAIYHPPKELATVERHFADLEAKRKKERIKDLERELKELRKE